MLIYCCTSSHGFGHAARDAALLQQLHRLRPDWRLVISSMVPVSFLRLMVGSASVEIRRCLWDVGMVQADALGSDPEGTLTALAALQGTLSSTIDAEVSWITAQGEPVLLIADIPPSAADLAERLGAPLIWFGNFGWDEIYAPFGGALADHAGSALEAYRRGTLLLRCPFALGMDWKLPEERLDLVCAEPRPLPEDLQDHLHAIDQPLVMVGFGGLGLTLETHLLQRWPDHHFLMMSSPQEASGMVSVFQTKANVTLLPQGFRPLDAFPHCSRHLGKPGFSTFCEAMAAGIGLHVVERQAFAEVTALMKGLKRHAAHRILTREAFRAGDWELDQPLEPAACPSLPAHGARQAAEHVVAMAETL